MGKNKTLKPRTQARFSAVQALYQYAQTGDEMKDIISDFIHHPLIHNDNFTEKFDHELFKKIVVGVLDHQQQLDDLITPHLDKKWRIERLPIVIQCLLRSACFELKYEVITPTAVILDQYIEISKHFFDEREVSFVNAVLDKISKSTRLSGHLTQEG